MLYLKFAILISSFTIILQETSARGSISLDFQNHDAKTISEILQTSVNSTLAMIQNLQSMFNQTTSSALQNTKLLAKRRIVKTNRSSQTDLHAIIDECIEAGNYSEKLHEIAIAGLDRCAITVYVELVNIITSAVDETSTFLDFPNTFADVVGNCGLSDECIAQLVEELFYQSLEVPSKILVVVARIQEYAFSSIKSVTRCTVMGMENIMYAGLHFADEIITCADGKIN